MTLSRLRLLPLFAVLCTLSCLAFVPSAVAAPDITMQKIAPGSVLYGETSPVTLRVSNPDGQPTGYNLTIRDVLPEGISYVADPTAPIAPRIIEDEPEAGQTTLIFDNVSDLSGNSHFELSYRVSHDPAVFDVGDSYENDAFAYISDDARFEPEINADGTPGDEDIDGSASASATTQISAIEIVKDELSSEGELMRGVHKHKTVYTLTVNNNSEGPTDAIRVEDWIPAGLEFLGCADVDNTTDAPTNPVPGPEEYPGSGSLTADAAPAHPSCIEPDSVETVSVDPDDGGPMPSGIYTHVVWNDVADLEIDGQTVLQYVAGIPLRENTMTWSGGLPPATDGAQASNLDNNSGPETFDEQPLRNYALATGTFEGQSQTDDYILLRHAEDLAVHKAVDLDSIVQGQVSEWSLHVRTSEYRFTDDIVMTDTLPDGLCPLGGQNYEDEADREPECAPDGTHLPSHDYTTVTEQTDGKYTIVWDSTHVPQFGGMQPSSEVTITFPTRTRSDYQQDYLDQLDSPVLAEDSWTNNVSIAGSAARICTPSDPECLAADPAKIDGDNPDPRDVDDVSAAEQHAGSIHISKQVLPRAPTFVDCDTGTYVDGPVSGFGPGDTVCWQLRIDFPGQLDTGHPTVTDFLPPGVSYVDGSAYETGADTVSATLDDTEAANGVLTWELPGDVPPGDLVFEWRFETTVDQAVASQPGEVEGNLMKVSFPNTPGESFPMRDSADIERSQALLDLVKDVRDVNDGPVNPANTDGVQATGGDDVTFRIEVSNEGDLDAADAVIWDELEDGITCANVPPASISDGGTCTGTRITWEGIAVPAAGTHTLTYDVDVPGNLEPGRQIDNRAGVVSYTSATNTGTPFPYVPTNNINPSATGVNAPAADDDSSFHTPQVTISKTRTTDVDEGVGGGNNLASEATIGELIHYRTEIVVPEGTTLYGTPTFTDDLGARQTFVDPPAAAATLDGDPIAVDPLDGFTLDTSGNVVSLEFPAPYENAPNSDDDTIEITFSARVADHADNHRADPHLLPNTAHFAWENQDATPHSRQSTVNTTIVEPDVAVTKAENDADDVVEAGQAVGYTVTARNLAGDRVSVAHDVVVVDDVPAGMTPSAISDGGSFDGDKITWTIPSIDPGDDVALTYTATVDEPANAGEVFHNTADMTATSLAGNATGERTSASARDTGYVAAAEATVALGEATMTKTVAPTSATIGQQATYTAEVTFPANVNYYDVTVIDTLPDGLVYDGLVGVACTPCGPDVEELPAEPQTGGGTKVAWYLGDLPSDAADRTYTIVYRAHVAVAYDDAAPVQNGNTLVNAAQTHYNGADAGGAPTSIPDPGTFSDHSNPVDADLDVVEPNVTIDKGVSGDANDDDVRDTQPGDSYTYSLVVRNGGDSPAYDIDVTDTPDETLLRNITPVANPAATIVDGEADVDGTLAWTIPGPIEPNESVTLTYTADLAPSADLHNDDTVVNVADVTSYWGVPTADHTADPSRYREYTDVPDDTVTLDVHLPELAVDKTTPNGAVAEVGEAFTWRVEVTNQSTYTDANDVDVRDVLPPDWTYVAGSATLTPGGDVEPAIDEDPAGDELTWSDVGDLAPGESVVVTFEARPAVAAIANGTGAVSPHINDADATAVDVGGASGSADGPYAAADDADAVLEIPDIAVSKTPDGATVDAGAEADYTITIANDGDVPARDVVVTDVLGPNQTYSAGTATAAPGGTAFGETSVDVDAGTNETTIVWTVEEIPANDSVTITVPVETDPSLPSGTGLVNDASVVSREITTPVDDGGSLQTDVNADVGIDKQAQADPVDAGEVMDFTLHVYNDGPSDATGVTVQDVLPSNLTFVSATGASCDADIGTVTCDIGALADGDSVDITLRVQVSPDETTGVSNTATVASDDDSNPDNDSSTADKPIGVASNVVAEKTAPTEPILQGTSFDYVIRVSNDGISAAADVTLSDPLPTGVTFDAVVTDTGTCDEDAGTVECSFGTLEPDQVAEVTVTVFAAGVGDPLNTATAATTSNETDPNDNEDGAPVTILPTADLGVTKSAAATVQAGGQLTYTLEVVNNGASDATGVTLTDTLPNGVDFLSADTGCDEAAGIVTCAVGNLPATESRDYDITVHVPYALADQDITNTVVVSGDEDDLDPDNNDDDATTTVGPAANVVVVKTAPAEPILQGTSFDYVIRVSNDGISAADDVTLSDPLPAGVVFDEVATDTGTCDEDAGTVECSFGTLAPDQVAEVTVTVFAQDVGEPINTATGATTTNETDPDDNDDSVPVTIVPTADLAVTKSASATVAAGGELSYLLQVINNGSSDASGVTLTDTLPVGVEFVSADSECAEAAGIVTCDVGDLPVTESRDYTITVRVPYALADQEITNAVIVGGNEGDLFPDNDSDQATTTVGPAADVSISKTSNGATAGSTASWTLVVANHGPSTAEPVTVVDTLPAGTTLRSASPGQGTCGAAGATVTCDLGAIASGGSTQISIVADVPAGTAGQQLVNRATVTAPQPDPDPSNNTGEVTTPIGQPAATGPNLTMSKTASTSKPRLGKSYSYRLVVTNTGDAPAEEVHVVDTMSKALEIDKVTTSKGTCDEQGTTVECDLGTLAAGEEERIRLVVTPTGTGRIRNVASANSRGGPSVDADGNTDGQSDLDPSNNDDTANVRVSAPAAGWTLRKRASRSVVRGGETVRFRIAVRVSRRAVADARVCDRLPSGLVFVRAPGARFRDGRACWTLRYLAPGARRTLRIVARAERGFSVKRVRNVAVAKARNASRRAAAARVRIDPAFGGDGGGVTG